LTFFGLKIKSFHWKRIYFCDFSPEKAITSANNLVSPTTVSMITKHELSFFFFNDLSTQFVRYESSSSIFTIVFDCRQ